MAELNELTINGSNYTFEDDVARGLATTEASRAQAAEQSLQTAINNKVDKVTGKGLSTNDYTNDEKAKLAGLNNYDDTQVRQLIAQTNANFANYYTKAESYSATEVDTLLRTQRQGQFVVVNTLPTPSADTMFKIYLVPSTNPETQNVKNEFVTLENNGTYSWEQIGTTAVDLSGYSTTEEMNAAIASALASYYTKSEVDDALGGKQNTIDDLANIRSGASAGATAVQPSTFNSALSDTVAESGVYDVTANNNNAKFASLSALLGSENLDTLIPSAKRKGGMSIKFVQSSDNKYVQYRLMSDSFNTNSANWQGVDVTPVAGSKNLIESGALKYQKKNLIDYLLKNIKLGKSGTRVASVYGNEGVWAGTIKGIKLMSGDSVYLKSTGNAYVINGYITDADGYQISDLGNGEIRYKAATTCYLYIVARKSDSSALPSGWRDEIAADYIAEGYISSEEPTISYKTLSRISGNNYSVSEINNVDNIRTDYIKVSAGDTLTFNGRLSGISTNNNICGIAAFYKKDLSCFAGWLLNNEMEGETTDKNVDYTDKQVIVPAGVEYIIIDCKPNSSRPFNWFDMITITPTVNIFNYKEANVEWVYGALSNGTVITYNYQYPRIRTQEVLFMPAGSYITLRKSVQQVDIYLYDKKTFETTDRKISLTAQNNFRYIFKEDSYISMALNIFNQRVPLDEVPEYVEVVRTNYNDYLSQDTILGFYSRRAYLGDMSFVILPNGENLVVDTYNSSDWNNVRAILYGNGISHIDNMVISHYHVDHVGNMLNMIENGMFDDKSTVYLPQMLDPNAQNPPEAANWASFCQSQDDIIAALTEVGSTIIHPTEGQIVTLCEEFNLKFINCDHSSYFGQTTDYNNWSLCCYLFVGENNIFYSGDIMNVAEATIAPNVVKTTILKAEHHGMDGGKNALVPAYINRIVPDVVIACDYSQHDVLYMQDISPMVSWCQSNSVSFYRTSENSGLIKVDINKDGWCFEGSTIRYIRNNKNWNFNDNLEYPLYDLSLFTKVGACGDSVTKGSMYKTDSWAGYRTDLAWHHILARNYGFKCYAFAVGGMSTETFITNPECLPKLLNTERLDLYFLFLGINDAIKYSTESNYLGTIADIHVGSPEQNPDSFYGNYGKIIETIQGYAPASLQIMMTVKYTEQYRGYITQINTAIKAIAALYGLPCIDLYNTPVYESSVYAQSLYGGHPTPILHSAIAKQIECSFYECVVKNTTYFDNYSTKYLSNGTFAERPAADSVPVGSTYWDTTNNCVWECNGIGADVSWIKIYDSTEQIE